MNLEITTATQLLMTALNTKNEDDSKAAYKKVKQVTLQLVVQAFSTPVAMTDLDILLRLDSRLLEIQGKYQKKLHAKLLTLADCKAALVAQPHLDPHGKISLQGLDLLKTHSPYIREHGLPDISDAMLKLIIQHLSNSCQPTLTADQLIDFYRAADFLGITSLEQQTYAAMKEVISKKTYDELLHMLCKIASGKHIGKGLAQAVLETFIEHECRYAHNIDYLEQPSPYNYITCSFCPLHNISIEDFRHKAKIHLPGFIAYLDALQGSRYETADHYLLFLQDMGEAVKSARANSFSEYKFPNRKYMYFSPYKGFQTSWLYLLDWSSSRKFLEKTQATETQKAITEPLQASFELLRDNPKGWIHKVENEVRQAKTPQEKEKIIDEVLLVQKRFEPESLEKLNKFCHGILFKIYWELGKFEETKAQTRFLSSKDQILASLGIKTTFVSCLYEMGNFSEQVEAQDMKQVYLGDFRSRNSQGMALPKILASIATGITFPGHATRCYWFNQTCIISLDHPINSLMNICEQLPLFALPRIVLAHYYWKIKQDALCLECCNDLLRLQKNPEILSIRTALHLKLKSYNLAEKDCLQLLQTDFSYRNLLLYVQCLHDGFGYEKARQYLNQLKPSHDVYCATVELLLMDENVEEAEQVLKEHVATESTQYGELRAKIDANRSEPRNKRAKT